MDHDRYLKKDLTTILLLTIIFSVILALIYFWDSTTNNLDSIAAQLYAYIVN